MFVSDFEHVVHRPNVSESHETETTRPVGALILQNHDVIDLPELLKVMAEGCEFEVVWEAAHEHFPQLGVNLVVLGKKALRDF